MAADTDAFPQLSDAELATLGPLGVRRAVAAGEYLYRESDPGYDFYVVLSGAVEIFVRSEGQERIIARHEAGRFLGELNLLTGQRVFVSARVAESGEVLAVPRDALRGRRRRRSGRRSIGPLLPRLRPSCLTATRAGPDELRGQSWKMVRRPRCVVGASDNPIFQH